MQKGTFDAPFEKRDVKAGSRNTLVDFNGIGIPDGEGGGGGGDDGGGGGGGDDTNSASKFKCLLSFEAERRSGTFRALRRWRQLSRTFDWL